VNIPHICVEALNTLMAQLTENQIQEFMRLWKNHFGHEISRKDAFSQGIKLVRLMELVYRPMTENDYQSIQSRIASICSKSEWQENPCGQMDDENSLPDISGIDCSESDKYECGQLP